MMLLFKFAEFVVFMTLAVALTGAYLQHKDSGGTHRFDELEASILWLLVTDAVIHFINLFR